MNGDFTWLLVSLLVWPSMRQALPRLLHGEDILRILMAATHPIHLGEIPRDCELRFDLEAQ